jgi:hypothetical protein
MKIHNIFRLEKFNNRFLRDNCLEKYSNKLSNLRISGIFTVKLLEIFSKSFLTETLLSSSSSQLLLASKTFIK